MIGTTSFLSHLGSRPPRYRTPSPPRRAVEPISPTATTDFRTSLADRAGNKAASFDRDQFASNNNGRPVAADGETHHRSGHGRSSSTIDTLATIALATSPTFAPLSYKPPPQNSESATPLFPPEPIDPAERPAKRPRPDNDSSTLHFRTGAGPQARPSAVLDSMKTDAELLLNFARPTNFPPISHSKRVSVDESYRQYGDEAKHQTRVGFGGVYMGGPEDEKFTSPGGYWNGNTPPSRMRSQSDGSAFASRPVIRGVRPNTSSSTLPPIVWQEEGEENKWDPANHVQGNNVHVGVPTSGPMATGAVQQQSLDPRTKMEDDTSEDSNKASCAACNLVRIPVDTEEQGDVTWISCDGCKRWFHIVCAGFKNDREIRTVDKFICRSCRPMFGQTTFVRKSSRARTAIDYAGLNQGLVKAASDSLEHHYVEPIRQGKIRFLPETFPRMDPALVNAEYFERGNGMTEPIVIPAHLNRRHDLTLPIDCPDYNSLVQDAPTQEMFDELLEHLPGDGQVQEVIVDCGQDQLDMVIPHGLTVRAVAELYGPEERVEVIDVKSQQGEDKRWNMQKWADYYESPGDKVVRNVISLEVSQSKLGRLVRRPKVVRDLDLQDAVWPKELLAIGEYPKVQFYCLMSVADCYTDFHIDFGGSSVYYHILKGKKTFFFIPPKDKHLKKYEEWCNSPAQDTTFLGDQTKECYRVDLVEGDTMLIPSGWIHAVWTPENSLVIGGNFLTRLNYGMQIKIAKIEKDTKVPRKFRYPFFQKIQWYTAMKYVEEDPIPQSVLDAFAQDETHSFHREYPIYYEFGDRANRAPPGSPYHNSRFYSQAELEGLPDLVKYLLRTALIAGGYIVEGVTADARNAVKKSIPKGSGDPIDAIRKFGIWVAWKRGNEQAPQWTRPGVIESNSKISFTEKKPAGRPSRRSERSADNQRMYAERQAVQRPPEQHPEHPVHPVIPSSSSSDVNNSYNGPTSSTDSPAPPETNTPMLSTGSSSSSSGVRDETAPKPRTAPRGSGLGPKRVACDACRKRRIRCRHKDEPADPMTTKQMGVNAFGSMQNQAALAHDAASALNSLAAIASEAGLQDGSMVGLDRFENSGKYNPAIMSTPQMAASKFNDVSPDGGNSGKKGRSKACDDCRKSKRRCIHDEYGRIDPVKAQERSKPRATTSAKRPRPNEEDGSSTSHKKMKQESTSPSMRMANLSRREGEVLHAQTLPSSVNMHGAAVSALPPSQAGLADSAKEALQGQTSYASPPAFQTDTVVTKEVNSVPVSSKPAVSLVSPPTSLADETEVANEQGDGEGEHATVIHTPTSSSRHSSRQPRHVDRYMPEPQPPKVSKPSTHTASARRSSFGGTSAVARKTTPGPSTSKKASSRPSSSHAKKSSAFATDSKFNRYAASLSPRQSSKHAKPVAEKEDPDMESLRLIREIQEQEFGLRKRSTRT